MSDSRDPDTVGIRRCMRCGWLFVSADPCRIGRCLDCKRQDDGYQPRLVAHMLQIDDALRHHTPGDS